MTRIYVYEADTGHYGNGLLFIVARNRVEAEGKLKDSAHRDYVQYLGTFRQLEQRIRREHDGMLDFLYVE